MKPKKTTHLIDGKDLSLSNWLKLISSPPRGSVVANYKFPTDSHKLEYLATVADRSEQEFKDFLRNLLIPSCSLGCDQRTAALMLMGSCEMLTEFERRLFRWKIGARGVFPWEGITWVLDLCSWRPKDALAALSSYISAHIQFLPEDRIDGLYDALDLIRARYIGTPQTTMEKRAILAGQTPRQFECLVERTYSALGYATTLTPAQKDGGRDILAEHFAPGRREHLRIECKRHSKAVTVGLLRSLLGVVSSEKANKGVLVASGRFTKPAVKFSQENPRLELIDGSALVLLMNENLGPMWPVQLESLVIESERHSRGQPNTQPAFIDH